MLLLVAKVDTLYAATMNSFTPKLIGGYKKQIETRIAGEGKPISGYFQFSRTMESPNNRGSLPSLKQVARFSVVKICF